MKQPSPSFDDFDPSATAVTVVAPDPRRGRALRLLGAALLCGLGFGAAHLAGRPSSPEPAARAAVPEHHVALGPPASLLVAATPPEAAQPAAPAAPSTPGPANATTSTDHLPVDLVLCVDVSGSMEELLDACRKQLWDVCNLFARALPTPRLRVALITFGGESAGEENGYVRLVVPFTDELDRVYERLMALSTGGGTELVGRALHVSLDRLDWRRDPRGLSLVFVAGNESADQDTTFSFRAQAQKAAQRQIRVCAVYCGQDEQDADAASYRELARLGGGRYAAIDPGAERSIPTPYDAELARLGREINETYLPFGAHGAARQKAQLLQDENSARSGAATLAARMQIKGSAALYCNRSWDLVDACAEEDFDLAKLPDAALPPALRGKSLAEKRALVEAQRARRKALQDRLRALGAQRDAFVAAERARLQGLEQSLGFALEQAVRSLAKEAGFCFDGC